MRLTPLTRPSPISSWRRSSSPTAALFSLLGGWRSPADQQIWAAHIAVVEGEVVGGTQFETDRARFLGRGRGHSYAGLGD